MAAIKLEHAESSNIASASYDEDSELLVVTFRSGASYEYASVPPPVAKSFEEAPSPGSFLHNSIKPLYQARKIG